MDADRLVARHRAHLRELLPPDPWIGDAHTHLGLDEDGMRLDLGSSLAMMEEWGVRRALVFPLHEADRHPAYRVPNDRVLDWAARSDGRLVPLARLDLAEDPIAEARRAIARGARGIKLHPRAQAFTVDDERLEPVFALAEEARLPVLIHAGRGMPPIGAHLAAVAQRHPGAILILAHAAIVDQERIADLTAGHANVFFDTSTWSVFDILALLARVAPEQVLFATDVPYGNHLSALTLIAAVLEQIGASEAIRRGVMGETLEGILRGELPVLSAPLAPPLVELSPVNLRLAGYLSSSIPMLWLRQRDVIGMLGLAAGVCEGDPALEPLHELIVAAGELWEATPLDGNGGWGPGHGSLRDALRLLQLAHVLAVTPRALERLHACA
jgi:predicted TIM-barrel fold metal-dependent hydrolase